MCGRQGCRHGHGTFWHAFIKIVLLLVVFWLGFQLGEIRAFLKESYGYGYGSYGRGMMRGYNSADYNGIMPMMGVYFDERVATSSPRR